jgi:hypothetical protein
MVLGKESFEIIKKKFCPKRDSEIMKEKKMPAEKFEMWKKKATKSKPIKLIISMKI